MTPKLRLNHRLLAARVHQLGLSAATVRNTTGFDLGNLERDPDQRTVTLAMLARLHGLLGLSVDKMLLDDRAAKRRAAHDEHDGSDQSVTAAHAQTLLAVLVTRDGVTVDALLAASGWTLTEFETGLAHLRTQLAETALQIVGNDTVLYLGLRPGTLPDSLRAALARPTVMRRGLDANTAIDLLRLVRQEILRPVPGSPLPIHADVDPQRDHDTRRLLDAGVAVGRGTKSGDEVSITYDNYNDTGSTQAVTGLRIHPDVMFALGLTARPARRRPTPRWSAPEPDGPEGR
ncbi:DNA-binding protein [Nocardia sp. NPDC050193]